MCFGFRKKMLRQQQEATEQIRLMTELVSEMEKKVDDEVHELEDQEKKLDQAGEEEQQLKKEMLWLRS